MLFKKRRPEPIRTRKRPYDERGTWAYTNGVMATGHWRDETVLAALCGSYGRIIYDDQNR